MRKIAVVILNWNTRAFLRKFLPILIENSPSTEVYNVEIVVADNGSMDDSVDVVASEFSTVTLIRLDKNYGFTGGYNRALSQVAADYFVLLNSDVEVSKGWITPLFETLEGDRTVAAAAPKILSYNNRNMFEYAGAAGGYIDRFGFPFCRGRRFATVEEDKGQYDAPEEVFWASGAAMFIRADLYRDMGGLDESYFAHMEEIDLCWRLKGSGYRIMAEPRSVVYHVGGGTLSNDSPRKLFFNFRNNLFTLYKNLPGRYLFVTLLARMVIDGGIGMIYLIKGRIGYFGAVVRGHWAFYGSLRRLCGERKGIKRAKEYPLVGMNGFIGFK